MSRKILIPVIVILTFLAGRYLKYFYGYVVFGKEAWNAMDDAAAANLLLYSQIILVLISTVIVVGWVDRMPKKTGDNLEGSSPLVIQVFSALGLTTGFGKGFLVGLLCTLPMVVGYGFMAGFQMQMDWPTLHRDLVAAGFFEEFMYRGFFFGLLFYRAGWGFIPAVIIPSIYFGIGHLYQAEAAGDSLGIFLFTALGSAGFAWFYVAYRSLWPVIFLHAFMDLTWTLFDIETNVTGNLMVNVFRFTTLGLMVVLAKMELKKMPENSINGRIWVSRN